MITVRWFWINGSVDEFQVENIAHAKSMVKKLYKNPDIVMVEIEE